MPTAIDRRSSDIINALRFPLTLVVLASHCVLVRSYSPISLSLDGDNLFHALDMIFRSFGSVVVAWFGLISGFFFFGKETFSTQDYGKAVKSRSRSLLIPYILWNIIYIAVLWAKNDISTRVGFSPGIQPIEQELLRESSLLDLLLLPINHPLWYIRELIYLTIASPIIYLLLRYFRLGAVLLVGVFHFEALPASITPEWMPGPLVMNIYFYFVLGAYLRRSSIDPVRLAHRLQWVGIVLFLSYFVLLLGASDQPFFPWAFKLATIGILILAFNVCAYLYDRGAKVVRYWTELSRTAFFVYSIHAIVVINLIRGFLYTTPLANNGYGHIAILLITAGSVSILSVLAYYIAVRIAPRITAILCGGRI